MAKYAHSDILDNGIEKLRTTAVRVLVIKAYAAADSYATVTGNAVISLTITTSDFGAIAGADGAARTLAFNGKSGTASAGSGATPNLHIAFTDGTSKVLLVTDETSDQVITSGNTVNIPSISPLYTSNQPT